MPESEAGIRVDPWSIILLEMGHILGHDHEADGIMQEILASGVRKLASEYHNSDSYVLNCRDEAELVCF